MNDFDWIILLLCVFDTAFNNSKRDFKEMTYNMTTREAIEETIRKRLEDPKLPASEIKLLAEAYTELHKNDYMQEFLSRTSGFSAFGKANPPAQLNEA